MKSITPSIILISFLACAFSLKAQDYYKVFEVRYDYSPNNPYVYNSNNTADVGEAAVSLNLPLTRKNGDAWLTGLGYNGFQLTPHYASEVPPGDTAFSEVHMYYRYRAQFGYNRKFNDKYSLATIFMARLSSDMIDVEADHYQYGGLMLLSQNKREGLVLKYGLYVNTEFFSLFVIPLVGLDWKISEKLRAYGVLPANMTLEYKLGESFRGGLIFEAPTESYRVSDKTLTTSSGTQSVSAYVQNYKNVLYLYSECYILPSVVLHLRAGYTVLRRVSLYESDQTSPVNIYGVDFGEKRIPVYDVPAYRKFSDGLIFQVNISYRFKLTA